MGKKFFPFLSLAFSLSLSGRLRNSPSPAILQVFYGEQVFQKDIIENIGSSNWNEVSQDAEFHFLDCAGKTALFRGLRAAVQWGRRDVSRLLKAATRRRTPNRSS